MFTCIYCFRNEPDVTSSEAHIFPDAMGGVSSTSDTVCKDCNNEINRLFEQEEVGKFAFFQSIWGIKSRRNKVKGVPAVIEFEGEQHNVSLDELGIPKRPLIDANKNEQGIKSYSIIGPGNLVSKKQKEIDRKRPKIKWVEKDLRDIPTPKSIIKIDSNLKRISLLRLVAKVAYERWGQLRNAQLLNDKRFDSIREFILTGKETEPCCGIIVDLKLLSTMLNYPVGNHAVIVFAHPRSSVLGAFVTFYSLFYFWVVLATNFQALSAIDEPLIEDPQDQIIHEPLFRAGPGDVLIHWNKIIEPYLVNPEKASASAFRYAIKRFQEASNEFYMSNSIENILAQPGGAFDQGNSGHKKK